ncbi:MAG: hypothetical protein ABWY11_09340 [Umezawaea sp.]
MTSAEGDWELVVDTPIGKQHALLVLSAEDGVPSGVVRDRRHGGEVVLTDLLVDSDRVTWAQAITRPMRLNLVFDVTVDGDSMTGTSKAGRLPTSRVTGRRVATGRSGVDG